MSGRDRTLDFRTTHTGYYKYWVWADQYSEGYPTMRTGKDWRCVDRVGEWTTDNLLDVTKKFRIYPTLTGEEYFGSPPKLKKRLQQMPITGQYSPADPTSYFSMPRNWSELAVKVAAATNPCRPSVSLPTFLGEARELPKQLSDVPKQLRDVGRLLTPRGRRILGSGNAAKLAADLNLSYRFGWKPLMGDLAKLLGFMKAVEQRLAWLATLRSGGSIKGRLFLPFASGVQSGGPITTQSFLVTTTHTWVTEYKARSWLTARWALDSGAQLPSTGESEFWLAWRLALGLSIDEAPATAWELMPWSWMIDWFWNIGSWLQAINRALPVHLVSICWCRTSESYTKYKLQQAPPSWCQISGDYNTRMVVKQRRAISPLLGILPILPSIPGLTWGQWSILGSLWVQRQRRRPPR